MEDARFVRFVDDDGGRTYYATYTAFDGAHIAPQLLATTTSARSRVTQLGGPAAREQGHGAVPAARSAARYVALSRWDRETNGIVVVRRSAVWDDADLDPAAGASRGSSSSSATAVRRSRPPPAGSC